MIIHQEFKDDERENCVSDYIFITYEKEEEEEEEEELCEEQSNSSRVILAQGRRRRPGNCLHTHNGDDRH